MSKAAARATRRMRFGVVAGLVVEGEPDMVELVSVRADRMAEHVRQARARMRHRLGRDVAMTVAFACYAPDPELAARVKRLAEAGLCARRVEHSIYREAAGVVRAHVLMCFETVGVRAMSEAEASAAVAREMWREGGA